jgi:hypothetical protein
MRPVLLSAFTLLVVGVWPASLHGANKIYVDIVRQGQTQAVDTLYLGVNYEYRIWIENDSSLSSFRITLRTIGTLIGAEPAEKNMGAYWSWLNVGGYGPSGLGTGKACITVVPGSRMDPPGYVWDYGSGLLVFERNVNEVSPDTIGIGGTATYHGLPPGPLQHMVSIHFKANLPSLGEGSLWLDTAKVLPGGGNIFVDWNGNVVTPSYSSSTPWTILAMCGDADADGSVGLADAIYLVNYIFKSGPPPPVALMANVNCDSGISLADVVYLIDYIFKSGEPPCCL